MDERSLFISLAKANPEPLDFAKEFVPLTLTSSLEGEVLKTLFRLGISFHQPVELPDSSNLTWQETVTRCLESLQSRAGIPSEANSAPLVPSSSPLPPLVPSSSPLPPLVPSSSPLPPLVPSSSPSSPLALSSSALPERPRDSALPERPRESALPERPRDSVFPEHPRDSALLERPPAGDPPKKI